MSGLVSLLSLLTAVPTALAAPFPEGGFTAPEARAVTFPWPGCQINLTCDFAAIQSAPSNERQLYLIYLESYQLTKLDVSDQFRALEGVHQFFLDQGLSTPGTWTSYTEAANLEAIQRAAATLLGYDSSTGGNPGTDQWVNFITTMSNGGYSTQQAHDKAWSLAEQAGSEHGITLATAAGITAAGRVQRWDTFYRLWRAIMQDHNLIGTGFGLNYLGQGILRSGYTKADFNAWFFNVSNPDPLYCYTTSAYGVAQLFSASTTPLAILNDVQLLLLIFPRFRTCYASANPKSTDHT
ncbi:hypothetical protein NKR23_g7272 [Pleurostoma richardsiae]|uniref:Uncharacterized protein n=1 Tax=Pleurostoma richardsiae TaxID=41990 RepID=A0AA38RIF7_9PEZI|nr:hypothetical protein NKR23_g7272 [Pleurostoma richardsiae]